MKDLLSLSEYVLGEVFLINRLQMHFERIFTLKREYFANDVVISLLCVITGRGSTSFLD